jgi:competence protein ComFB
MAEVKKDYVLINTTEEIVKKKVRETMQTFDTCQCEKCYFDVCALVLNKLEPKYYTTERGKVLQLLEATDKQFKTDLVVLILQSIQLVKESPRH